VLACVIAVTLGGQGLLLPAVVRWLGLGSHRALAWWKSMILQATLWLQPYIREGDF